MWKLISSRAALAAGVLAATSGIGCAGNETGGDYRGLDLAPRVDAGAQLDTGVAVQPPELPQPDAQVALPLTRLPCEVQAIIETKCGTCHGETPAGGAPSLTSAAAFQGTGSDGQKLYTTARGKLTETDPRKAMPPAGQPELTAGEMTTLLAWLDRGAPGSATECEIAPEVDAGASSDAGPLSDDDLDCYRLLAHDGPPGDTAKYPVGAVTDAYMSWTFAPPWKEDASGIVIRPVIDNVRALHHWLLYQDVVPGVPAGAVRQIGAHPTGQLLAGWAPGTDPMDFRKTGKSVGLDLPASTTYTLEIHYNSSDPSALDASGVEVCVSKQKVEHAAAYSWVGSDNLVVPQDHWTGVCSPVSQEPIHIVTFFPHMHLKGVHMTGTVIRKDGTKEVVHDADFDFNYQRTYQVDVTLNPGDSLQTDCYYSEPTTWGQPTTSEMCYLFSMAYPKGALASPDVWGTVAHGASSCLGQ